MTVDEAYVRESILDPHAKLAAGFGPLMPIYRGQLSEEQVLQLIAYIRSLTDDEPPQRGGGAGTVTGGAPSESQRSNPLGPTSPQQQRRAAARGGGNTNTGAPGPGR